MIQLQWRDDDNVYKPIDYALSSFLEKNRSRLIDNQQEGSYFAQQEVDHLSEMLVFVNQSAESKLIEHLLRDPNNEAGGVLVGNAYYCPTKQKHYTEIEGSIPARFTIGNRVHLRFTPECWQKIFKIQKERYPRTTIVGWYHSHPGHGVRLSSTDLNTQRLCFGKIWQIAIVYDTVGDEIGYFFGGQGKQLSPVYLSSSIPPSDEETSEPLVPRRIELPQLPEREANRNIGANASNLEPENSAQDANPRQNPENSGWSIISIFDGLNDLLKQFFRFILVILGGGR